MIVGDSNQKRRKALSKVLNAIKKDGGTTILSTGITGDDARLARAAVAGGAKMLEPNHPAVALARGHKGVVTMHNAEQIRHEISLEEMLKVTKGIRNVVGEKIYITVGVPGGFTETLPLELKEEDFFKIAMSGADGLHVHKSTFEDLEDIVNYAHKYGLLVDAYIGHPTDLHTFGVPAKTPEEVSEVAKKMEKIGVDMIGLMTGMSYEGVDAGEIHPEIKARLEALTSAVNVPTLAEGGINAVNYHAFKGTGVNILVIGTSIDNVVSEATTNIIKKFLSLNKN